jgi:hypothetical protein
MDKRILFVETVNDLHEKLEQSVTAYSVLKTSALLRQLLLDQNSLLDQVRQGRTKLNGRRLDITYRIAVAKHVDDVILADKPVFWAVGDNLYPPHALPAAQIFPCHLPEFLRTRVMIVSGYTYSVKDVIRQLAHVEGGVHVGTPKDDKERVLTETAESIAIGGLDPAMFAVRAIGRVAVAALEPLKNEIERELRNGPT